MFVFSSGLDDAGDGAHDAMELGKLLLQLLAAVCGEGVVAGAAIAGGGAPLGDDPAFDQHALEGRVERAFFDSQDLVGIVLDGVGYLETVETAAHGEGLEDQQIQGSGRDFVSAHRALPVKINTYIVRLCKC